MATYVRGAAIPHATKYCLINVDLDEAIAEQRIGRTDIDIQGTVSDQGGLMGGLSSNGTYRTDLIHIEELADDEKTGEFASIMPIDGRADEPVVYFYKRNDELSYCYRTLCYDEVFDANDGKTAYIKSFAESIGAKYIAIRSGLNGSWVCKTKDIFFRLDDIEGLPSGTTYRLAVEAFGEGGYDLNGDGVIYTNSPYCMGADGNPLVYTP